MDTTVLDMDRISEKFQSNPNKNQEVGSVCEDLGISLARTLTYGTPPATLGISPTMTKLTFGLSRSLQDINFGSTHEPVENRTDLGLGYMNNEFYLPVAGCPSMSELEPKLTDRLTLKGNQAKLVHVPLWHHTYYTSSYLIDDVTGELYACKGDELIAIKEQGYL